MKPALSLVLIPLLVGLTLGMARPIEAATKRFKPPAVPDLGRAVGSLRGGASRGTAAKLCPESAIRPAAIAPRFWAETGKTSGDPWKLVEFNPTEPLKSREIVFGQTLSDRPTFWFYSPYSLTKSRPGQFRLSVINPKTNRPESPIVDLPAITTEKAGLFAVELPKGISLHAGQLYRWSFVIRCGREQPISLLGSIQRASLNAPKFNPKFGPNSGPNSGQDALLFYLDNNLWYDAVNLAATDRRQWKPLLELVELLELTDPRLFPN
jgi:hypothetical protein